MLRYARISGQLYEFPSLYLYTSLREIALVEVCEEIEGAFVELGCLANGKKSGTTYSITDINIINWMSLR